MDLYEILELKPNASEVEIKKAYFRLAKIYHPDKNNSPTATEHFQKIHSAYEILINDKSRQEYQKMNSKEKNNFVEILEKIIKENINLEELKKYGINLDKQDFEYIQANFMNFFKAINVNELINLFKKGVVLRKDFNNVINCSDISDENENYDETCAEYYYNLPIFKKVNKLDIKIELSIKIGDIATNNKRKIKIKRNIEDENITSSFIFHLTKPYIIFVGAGDMDDGDYGDLIIKLNLPNNLFWNEDIILIEQSMSLYEMIYGLDICLALGENKTINIKDWVPSRDGFLINIKDRGDTGVSVKKVETNINLLENNLAIKLFLDYTSTDEKEQMLKEFFS